MSIGYGYRPWLAVLWLLGLWAIGTALLYQVDTVAAMCATAGSSYCVAPTGYPTFEPWIYVLDNVLPFLDLHQDKYWEPNPTHEVGAILRVFQWAYIGLGWLFSILAAVGFSGILRKD